MRNSVLVVFGLLLSFGSLCAQVSPIPVADVEVRDNSSIKMRSLEIERAKREANKPHLTETPRETETRITRISSDFETIQTLQSSIVKAYTTGKTINFKRISVSAFEMRKRAFRLGNDFFSTNVLTGTGESFRARLTDGKNLKDLVVALDNAVGAFVNSPVFERAVVDSRLLEKAQIELAKIILLSDRLSHLANIAN